MSASDRKTSEQGYEEHDAGEPPRPLTIARSERLQVVHEELEVATAGGGPVPQQLMDQYRRLVYSEYLRDHPLPRFAWPDDLYIPSEANYGHYWPIPPPDSHRYRYAWAGQTDAVPTACHASEKDGKLFSWVNVSGLNPGYIGYAGTGARFVPTSQLSFVHVGTTVDLVAERRWWYLPGTDAGYSHVDYRATVYLAVWQIDPVSGAWELVRPFGSRTIFREGVTGLGGGPISTLHLAFDDLGATVQLQGGRAYAVGVSFEVEMTPTFLDRSNKPYVKQRNDDVKLWASMYGVVESISIETTKILVP